MSGLYAQFEKHFVAVDNIIFGFEEATLKLLLVKRKIEPCKNEWSLMGGFIKGSESLDEAARRVVAQFTGLENVFMEQLKTYGAVNRDSEARTISVSYYTLIRTDLYDINLGKKYGARWFPIHEFPTLIFDHSQMVSDALAILQQKSRTQPIGFELLPPKFTIPQLRMLYEAINQKSFDPGNFSKKLKSMDLLHRLAEKDKSSSKKGAYFYEFDRERYNTLQKGDFSFSL